MLPILLLGLLQGLTEFLPVSSSGHLALAEKLLGVSSPGLLLEALLHLGTAFAVVVSERERLLRWVSDRKKAAKLLLLAAVATAVTGVVGIALEKLAAQAADAPHAVGLALLITGGILLISKGRGGELGETDTGLAAAAVIGFAQGLAVFPGISRSGATIVAALFLGLEREWAVSFSFLLSVPAVLAANAWELTGAGVRAMVLEVNPLTMLAGIVVAAASGLIAIPLVKRAAVADKLHLFAPYCAAMGLLALVVAGR